MVTNIPTDLFGGIGGATTDDGRDKDNGMSSLSPSAIGQEMGHGYRLDHSRVDGSSADYMDPWDIIEHEKCKHGAAPVLHGAGRARQSGVPHRAWTERSEHVGDGVAGRDARLDER